MKTNHSGQLPCGTASKKRKAVTAAERDRLIEERDRFERYFHEERENVRHQERVIRGLKGRLTIIRKSFRLPKLDP